MFNSNGWNNSIPNNYGTQPFSAYNRQLPHYEIVKVNGEQGAKSFQMAPNSSLILADNTNPNLLWLVQTDGAGYQTATPLDAYIHQTQAQSSFSDLEARVKHLEELYDRFNNGSNKQSKKPRQPATDDAANTTS